MSDLLHSTAYRVALTYSAVFALAVTLLGGAFYVVVHQVLLDQLDGRIKNEIIELETTYHNEGYAALVTAIENREQFGLSGELGYAVFDKKGKRITGTMATELPSPGARDLVFRDPVEGPDPARAIVRTLGNGLTLVVAADRAPLDRVRNTIIAQLLVALGMVVLISLAGGLILGSYLRKRMGALSASAEAIMAGDLSQRMRVSERNDEFDRLAVTLNAMLDRIATLMDNLRQVSSDIAHDLRTPLSQLRTGLEKTLTKGADPQMQRQGIEAAIEKTDHLLSLFAALLRISEVESRRLRSGFRIFDVSALMNDLCQSFAPAVEDGARSLHWSIQPDIYVKGDRELIAQAVINLLENAQKYTPEGTVIDISLATLDQGFQLTVADNGPGVSDSDKARMTGRFVRLEAARSKQGNGLGLNLVAAIADLHDVRLTFTGNNPGLKVSMLFSGEKSL